MKRFFTHRCYLSRIGLGAFASIFSVIAAGCTTQQAATTNESPPIIEATATPPPFVQAAPDAVGGNPLVVGLYPYVPRPDQFQEQLIAAWATVQPDVPLTFLPDSVWGGGYDNDPPPQADVFVFDAMFFESFRSRGFLEALMSSEVEGQADFWPYAIDGVRRVSGSDTTFYAIPQLGCGNFLFYRTADTPLASATTLSEVIQATGQCTYTSQIPPDRRGTMIDAVGGTTNAALYLDAEYSLNGVFPLPLPPNPGELDPTAVTNVRQLLTAASYYNATRSPGDDYGRAEWYEQGWGRSYIGFTESMSKLDPRTRAATSLKPMPLSDDDRGTLFYADVIGVNTTTNERGTRALAVELANLMGSSRLMIQSIGPDSENQYPQYLMATRPSVFAALGQDFPKYTEMARIVETTNAQMFALDSTARGWLDSMKSPIRTVFREDYGCGCDQPAQNYAYDPTSAARECNAACAAYGGWNGQWTNLYPAAQGHTACGCNACPAPATTTVFEEDEQDNKSTRAIGAPGN